MSTNPGGACGGRRRYRRGGEGEDAPAAEAAPAAAPKPASPPADVDPDDGENLGSGGRRRSRRHRRHGRKTLRAVPKGVHVKAKTLKRLLKAKGLKTTGKKSTLRARAREAHLIRGGR